MGVAREQAAKHRSWGFAGGPGGPGSFFSLELAGAGRAVGQSPFSTALLAAATQAAGLRPPTEVSRSPQSLAGLTTVAKRPRRG